MNAQVAELVDALDLKSSDHCGRAGSIPAPGTQSKSSSFDELFLFSKIKLSFSNINNRDNIELLLKSY